MCPQGSFRHTGAAERPDAGTLATRRGMTQTSGEMRTRVVPLAVLAALVGGGAFYTAAASGRERVARCSSVRVSGGDYNAATGGQALADVTVQNLAQRSCTISGRPWIRLGPVDHAVTVEDATTKIFGSLAGVPERVLTLRHGQKAIADILIQPGTCEQSRPNVFSPRVRAGWGAHSVSIGDLVCKNGTGIIWVGSFQKH
jgi:hypothetical protein